MRRFKLYGVFTGVILGFGLSSLAWAAITGISDVTVPAATYVTGSINNPVYEFQLAGSGTDTLQELIMNNAGNALINMNSYDISNLLTVWYQPSSPTFSPGAAVSVGTLAGIDSNDWSNGPLYSTPALNFPVTAQTGYIILTANIDTTGTPGNTIQMDMWTAGVTLGTAGGLGTAPVTNQAVQTIETPGVVNGISSLGAPGVQVLPGTTNVPVLELSLSLSGTSLFQSIQVQDNGTAYSTDITNLKVWYQAAGGNFSATSAVELGTLPFITANTYNDNSAPVDWCVNDGGAIYVTADLSATAISGHTLQFSVPSNSLTISGAGFANTLANAAAQTIVTPTPTPTNTPTLTHTYTPTVTMTPTNTSTPTWTSTITNTLTVTNTYTVTFTPTSTSTLIPTPTAIPTHTYTPTSTGTPTPTGSASPTPTPAVPLYLDSNNFNPNGPPLGMDVRVDTAGEVKVIVYNMAGNEVRKILDANLGAGNSRAAWDGRNSNGTVVGNGVYLVLIQTPSTKLVQKVIVLK